MNPKIDDLPEKSLPSTAALAWLEWLGSAPGQYAMAWEQEQFDRVVADVFGYHALQLGLPHLDPLRANRIQNRMTAWLGGYESAIEIDPILKGQQTAVVIDHCEMLPFASESIDLVVLPHVLELSQDPHQALREVERVLRPDGRLLITGFNPVSLWGARQLISMPLPDALVKPYLPEQGHFLSVPRLRDWLKLLSFDMDKGRYGCFAPPFRNAQLIEGSHFLEKAGDRWWPILGSVYFLSAVKRVPGMRLIGPAWKHRRAIKTAVIALPQRRIRERRTTQKSES
jgi:SAM-dependent methyltransferase